MIRRRVWQSLFVAVPVAAIALAGWATVTVAQEKKEEPKKAPEAPKGKTIVETAAADATLKQFSSLLQSADLAAMLKGDGPFTVFAATDDAFNKLEKGKLDDLKKSENKAKLAGILKYHVVKGKHSAADVAKLTGKTIKTENGEATVTVKDGKTMIDTATVTKGDIACSNGVIHIVDAVLMPKEKEAPKPAGGAH